MPKKGDARCPLLGNLFVILQPHLPVKTMKRQIKIWLECFRLRTLPVSLSGVVIAIGLAKWHHHFQLTPALLCLVFALLAQIVSNTANEYFDYLQGTDKPGRVGPRRGVTSSPRRCAT